MELLREWEDEQCEINRLRLFGEEIDVFKGKCPRIEKLREFRRINRGSGNNFSESKRTRKVYQGSVRLKLNKIPYREELDNVVTKDYKTFGYLDW